MVRSNTISESSRGDSGASSNPFLQIGYPSTSDYHHEIPHDGDPAHEDSGTLGSQSLPVEDHSGADEYQANP